MEIWLDDENSEEQFRRIISLIRNFKNGEVAESMNSHGILYKMNWGVSLVDLKEIAKSTVPSHVLSLKLWNRQWRETMILATLLDESGKVSEQQMDFWTKSFENSEIAEQASTNLWYKTPYAYVKALEWCRGKKHWVRFTAIHLVGRLAMMDKKSPDEMFEIYFEEFITLARDPALSTVMYRTMIVLANRSEYLKDRVREWTGILKTEGREQQLFLAAEIEKGLSGYNSLSF
jgi:3-methyladenine DNA glycosylase AlkD